MSIYVTKEEYEEILRKYGDKIKPPKSIIEGSPTRNMNKRSPIGLEFRTV
jgi:hypothetical protein